jgi:tRNA uridine 5-carboxymethylaminomethyl modification enzyme
MFTSRAEYRLLLREDNADLRLTEIGHRIGLASQVAGMRLLEKKHAIESLITYLESNQVNPSGVINTELELYGSASLRNVTSLAQLLRRPELTLNKLRRIDPNIPAAKPDVEAQAEVQIKYEGYVNRQLELVDRFRKMENVRLPHDLDYTQISGLSREVCEKLTRVKPLSIGQASRISGITPAALTLLSFHLKKRKSA